MSDIKLDRITFMQNVRTVPTFNIEPSTRWPSIGLRELWEYRELLYFLTWRDIKVRYKQTVLGAIWVIIQPVLWQVGRRSFRRRSISSIHVLCAAAMAAFCSCVDGVE